MNLLDAIGETHQKILRPSGGCHNCPRRRVDFVPATLPSAPVLWLGEGPGADEVVEGEGFVGKSGELLRTEAAHVGISPFACSNVVHCRPPKNAAPKPKEIACCLSQFVLDEIRGYPIVVLCGTTALTTLFPKAKANRFRGNIAYHPDFPGQRFYTIYHPAATLHNPNLAAEFKQQIARLGRIVAGEPPCPWHILQGGTDEMWAALDTALAAPLISFDIETTSLKSWDPYAKIRNFALTADEKTVIVVNTEEPHWLAALEKVRSYLEQPQKAVVGHSIAFDLDWLEHEADFTVQC
ncbi:hypothetical protein LCGC14_2076510, partial [marine sediment metagenome]